MMHIREATVRDAVHPLRITATVEFISHGIEGLGRLQQELPASNLSLESVAAIIPCGLALHPLSEPCYHLDVYIV